MMYCKAITRLCQKYHYSNLHNVHIIEDRDDDFELTAEMLIHGNADDEGTLEEEEMLEELEDEGSTGELTDLQKVRYCTVCRCQCTKLSNRAFIILI